MFKNTTRIALAVLLLAAPASAQFISDVMIVPVVAHTGGLNGTVWVTDLTIFNPMDYAVTVGIQFQPADRPLSPGQIHQSTTVLGPGETMMIEDLLPTWYGLEGDLKGWVLLITRPPHVANPYGTKVHATARIYNTGGDEGTYGQTIPAVEATVNVGWSSSLVTGARNDDGYRSNLGIACMNISVRANYRITASDGTVVAESFKDLLQWSMQQWSFDELGVGSVQGPLTVELWMDPADATPLPCAMEFPKAFAAYVSKVDNLSGDAEFLPAVPMSPFVCD